MTSTQQALYDTACRIEHDKRLLSGSMASPAARARSERHLKEMRELFIHLYFDCKREEIADEMVAA